MIRRSLAVTFATLFALAGAPAYAQAPAKGAAAAAPVAAAAGKELYPKPYFDYLLKERLAQGQPDSPELRNAVREELNTRELLVREAKKKGLDKNAEIKNQIDLTGQTVLVRAYVADWIKANPIPEASLRTEYDKIKSQIGDKEYKVRHILVEKEADAKEIIVALQKGERFEKLAEQSKDPGSKANGGDLDWNAPANFVKPFSEAMTKLEKGKFTAQPVQTQFGWHVIRLDDVRDAKVPPFEEVKPQLQQRLQAQHLESYFKELRTKNGV
ncbi:MAG: peptidyl-prolyl cis-trans isomerase [Betaproteobacteria bacterium]|jgi:peptidyl-prolyl cis-trans isomerase C|nr:peptidyl-prolyl cis-trans isomerase [Betaproteobacteria bacterium]MBK7083117.1 peptidyl-prolyl cis-trans isomerase [Betaproteobacteria bacterium]MBK7745600.1 peptidyl-prolyl cis-trans isomerase [Betaproteobacteria bacterium]MBK8689749.1 peptidyl-prolyl cis-trans isomerase [Betaproteobacteria bacterium]MBK9703560.1 peptidyl-prolyl cis-trans isomerase [Betaproteobacteria bacterium]